MAAETILTLLLAAVAGPLITQAAKEWSWVERWATVVNALLGLLFAAGVFFLWGSGDLDILAQLVVLALGGSQAGAVGYTVIKRATARKEPTLGEIRRMR